MTGPNDVDESLASVDERRPSVDRTGPTVDTPEINILRCELTLYHYILWFGA
jgi:hypothetical protein